MLPDLSGQGAEGGVLRCIGTDLSWHDMGAQLLAWHCVFLQEGFREADVAAPGKYESDKGVFYGQLACVFLQEGLREADVATPGKLAP